MSGRRHRTLFLSVEGKERSPPQPERVSAEAERLLRACLESVRDHWPGIAEADLPHVFDRFYRAAAARALPGSGLKQTVDD